MTDNRDEIYSKSIRAGRRTYFFDVRSTRADDFYLTITESKREFNEDGTPFYKKHKIYLYKEDFNSFKQNLEEMTNYIIEERGEDVISLNKEESTNTVINNEIKKEESLEKKENTEKSTNFMEINFDDLGKENKSDS